MGTTMPLLEFTLNRGERICAQSGAMKWMGSGIKMETTMAGGIGGALMRKLAGESAFLTYFTALEDGKKSPSGIPTRAILSRWTSRKRAWFARKGPFCAASARSSWT